MTAATTAAARNPSLWGFSPLIRSLGQDLGFIYVIMGGTIILYVLTLVWSGPEGVGGGLTSLLAPSVRANIIFGASGAAAGLSVRPMVDRPQRRLAARRPAAHRVQPAVGAPAGTGNRGAVWTRPHGHHLHRRLDRRIHDQLGDGRAACQGFP